MTYSNHLIVIDDDDAARRMMRRILERRGYTVSDAHDGASGIDAVRQLMPDAILLDLRMPGEHSGLDVTRILKGDPATSGIPIIVVSASVHRDARHLTKEAGCDAFLDKPVDFTDLYDTLDQFLLPSA